MSELINNEEFRKNQLKKLILKLHEGESVELVRKKLIESLNKVSYSTVIEVEQELINEGLPESEVIKLCDIHGAVLQGNVDIQNFIEIPPGHPVDVFKKENEALIKVIDRVKGLLQGIKENDVERFKDFIFELLSGFNELMDVEKHYLKKEYLLFPYLEENEIIGPPKVMWAKHDEIRKKLKKCIALLNSPQLDSHLLMNSYNSLFYPTLKEMEDMIMKEEEILFPMSMDLLTDDKWWDINNQILEIGYTLYDPKEEWKPKKIILENQQADEKINKIIRFSSGSLTKNEINAIMNTVPFDMTFVDRNDKVKYFTQGKERIFLRNRSIINRDVRMCHPPQSVDVVEKILEDFKTGKESEVSFWIQMKGKFIKIEYFALRDEVGQYLGTLEVSQDLTENRALQGEKRILSYTKKNNE